MNERIKGLAEHCDFYVGNEHYEKSHEEQQIIWTEKFAELIVQECIQQLQFERGNPYRNMGDIDGFAISAIDESIRRVKEHFGV